MTRAVVWSALTASLGCSAAPSVTQRETTVVVPTPPENHRTAPGEGGVAAVRGLDDFWRRFSTTLSATGEPLGAFTHPDLGVFALWTYGESPVVARFDDLEEIRLADLAPELSSLRAVALPPRMVSASAPCDPTTGGAIAYATGGPGLDDGYSAMRSAGLLPDDSTEDQELAARADQAIRYGVWVPARRLSFFLGAMEARWYVLAISVGSLCG